MEKRQNSLEYIKNMISRGYTGCDNSNWKSQSCNVYIN